MEFTDKLINSLLDNDKIISTELDHTIMELKKSLIPDWRVKKSVQQVDLKELNYKSNCESNYKSNCESNYKSNQEKIGFTNNFVQQISVGIQTSNTINEYTQDLVYDDNFYNKLNELHESGIIFDTKYNSEHLIEINSREIVFPVCCVGKNRSQYLFYYLKCLELEYPNHFVVGYPSSGDELSVITDYLKSNQISNNSLSNPNILSSYSTQYKKDSFSSSISNSFGILNPDKIVDIPRSIHIFDKIFKQRDFYNTIDLKNFEPYKYNINKYDIFDKSNNQIYEKIIKLYIKYFLTPQNLLDTINSNVLYKMTKITYICMSDKSFYNLTNCFWTIKKNYPEIKLNNIRIVYFGIQDIFQRSNIKPNVLNEFKNKLLNSIKFVYNNDIVMMPN